MSDDQPRCQGEKKNGDACTNLAIPALGVCHKHLDQCDAVEAERSEADRPVWERQAEDELRGGA